MLFHIVHFCTIPYTSGMLSPEQIAPIKAEIERLEKLREECTDSGIRKMIVAWIEAEKKKLGPDPTP
jgi:hypothetical protein